MTVLNQIQILLIFVMEKIVITANVKQEQDYVTVSKDSKTMIALSLFLYLIYVRVKIVIMENATINLENVCAT